MWKVGGGREALHRDRREQHGRVVDRPESNPHLLPHRDFGEGEAEGVLVRLPARVLLEEGANGSPEVRNRVADGDLVHRGSSEGPGREGEVCAAVARGDLESWALALLWRRRQSVRMVVGPKPLTVPQPVRPGRKEANPLRPVGVPAHLRDEVLLVGPSVGGLGDDFVAVFCLVRRVLVRRPVGPDQPCYVMEKLELRDAEASLALRSVSGTRVADLLLVGVELL